jgi:hypothetical protein
MAVADFINKAVCWGKRQIKKASLKGIHYPKLAAYANPWLYVLVCQQYSESKTRVRLVTD